MSKVYKRLLRAPKRSFFLFGARGTGKSTWLRQQFAPSDAVTLDLLDTSLQLELTAAPNRLEALIGAQPNRSWVVLDEVQKIPLLLDEVHRLIEERGWRFALCGSSARKLRRGGADLLAGRASTLQMEGFCCPELGAHFDVEQVLEWGALPVVWQAPDARAEVLSAYWDTYLREEIRAESVVRNYPPFVRFLAIAGQLNGQVLNLQNVAREAAVSRSAVEGYFSILQDTLLAQFLLAYRPGLKVRETAHPKFYWNDNGVARAAAGLLRDPLESAWKGFALEALIFHELRVFNQVSGKHRPLFFYRTAAGVEIDFLIETRKPQLGSTPEVVCVEVKLATRWKREWEKGMRDLARLPGVRVKRMVGVYQGARSYQFDGVDVLPVDAFLQELFAGKVF